MKYSAGMLDLLEALTLPEQPVLFLKLTIQPHICMERLKDAVSQCIAFLPELALRYDKKHNCWRKQKDDTFSMIQEVEDFDFSSWDIEHHAQLCIQIIHKEQQDLVCIGYSHILCDGDGATQILRLLTACYRQETVSFQNCRTPESLPIIKLKKIKTKRRKTIPAALPFAAPAVPRYKCRADWKQPHPPAAEKAHPGHSARRPLSPAPGLPHSGKDSFPGMEGPKETILHKSPWHREARGPPQAPPHRYRRTNPK